MSEDPFVAHPSLLFTVAYEMLGSRPRVKIRLANAPRSDRGGPGQRAYRRRGYDRAALQALLQRAAREPQIHTARVSIRPDNLASYQLASQYGFVKVGEQWDEEDGLEIIYEVEVQRP